MRRSKEIKPIKMSKEEVNKFFKNICKELEENIEYIIFRKLKKNSGYFVEVGEKKFNYIELDPRDEILPVLVHELTHCLHPEMDEIEVLTMERSVINRLSIRQYRKLLQIALPKMKNKKTIA